MKKLDSPHLGAIIDSACIVIACAFGHGGVHILTLLVDRSFRWGNKFSILLLIWFRK